MAALGPASGGLVIRLVEAGEQGPAGAQLGERPLQRPAIRGSRLNAFLVPVDAGRRADLGLAPAERLDEAHAVLLEDALCPADRVAFSAQQAAHAPDEIDILRPIVAPAAGPLPRPVGQGPFAARLVPAALVGAAVELTPQQWPAVGAGDFPWTGRGAQTTCDPNTTSIPGYQASWASASNMPTSPVQTDGKTVPVLLLPYGATNLRIAEIPTTTGKGAQMMRSSPLSAAMSSDDSDDSDG